MEYLLHIVPAVAVGLQVTLKIFIITIVLSLPLGVVMAIARISKIKPLSKFMGAYIYIMRGTPLMLQILFIYYGLPFIIDGLKLADFRRPSSPSSLTTLRISLKFSVAASSPLTKDSMKGRKSWA